MQLTGNILLVLAAVLAAHLSIRIVAPQLDKSSLYIVDEYSIFLSVIIAVVIVSFLTMVFAILIPKALGFKYADQIGRAAVKTLLLITAVLKYPVMMMTRLGNLLLKPFNETTNFYQTRLSEDEIRVILSESVKRGTLDETEQEIIENIFEFNDLRVNEVMSPRTEMTSIELAEDLAVVSDEILKSGHSLIPVYEDSVDNIVGVLHTKDVMKALLNSQKPDLKSIIRPAYFIPESKYISETLKEMQKRGERLAIVTDEYGGTEGVVSIEDILEELVGDLRTGDIPEYDKLPNGRYYVLGIMSIDDFNDTFNAELPESEEYNTVAGFVADKTGQILNIGQSLNYENLIFELVKKIRQKMVQFRVYAAEGEFKEKEE